MTLRRMRVLSALFTYPPYGSSAKQGHTLGYCGFAIWGDDVMDFLGQHCAPKN